ncbi:MAG TPA: SDR family oxidoreductase [Paraburkholderia sp.]
MAKPVSYAGRVALIAGGAGGMGRAIAARLIQRGVRCLLVDINAKSLAIAVEKLGPLGLGHVADLTSMRAIRQLPEYIDSQFGKLDILINNAAIVNTLPLPFEQRGVMSIKGELDINLNAPIVLTHTLLSRLKRAGDGRVITIVSVGGMFPLPKSTIYSAAKFGLRGAMLCLGMEDPRLGVKLGIVNPCATETPMLIRAAIEGGNKRQFMNPPQQPDEVATQVLHMLDEPCLERFVRPTESWLARLAMLVPNMIPKLIPMLRRQSEADHRGYVESLERRGLIHRRDGTWQLTQTDQ